MSQSPEPKRLKLDMDTRVNNEVEETDSMKDMFADSQEVYQEPDSLEDMFDMTPDDIPEGESSCTGGVSFSSLSRGPCPGFPGNVPEQVPPPKPSPNHTVCVELPVTDDVPKPHPHTFRDKWDEHHVKLPWSRENLYPVGEGRSKSLESRWDLIRESFKKIPRDSRQLEKCILNYNTRYRGVWSFNGLHRLFEEDFSEEESEVFFAETFPGMVDLLLRSSDILTCPIPLLKQGMDYSITMSQHQVSVILVNAFFCTFPRRNATRKSSEFSSYPSINFNGLFCLSPRRPEANLEKLKCLLSYFRQVVSCTPRGLITFQRISLAPQQLPDWENSNKPLVNLHLDAKGMIETEGAGMLQADFANKFVGGGVLNSGLVQEEIRFTVCPELIASMLFTEMLGDLEVLQVTGVQQFSSYSGYADTFRFRGSHRDLVPRDTSGRIRTSIVAMDAIRFSGRGRVQYRLDHVERELNKAFAAFSSPHHLDRLSAVATGNWGCGAFGGDARLKLLIQLCAASQSGRDMAYFTFGDTELVKEAGDLFQKLREKEVTVRALYSFLRRFNRTRYNKNGQELFDWIATELTDGEEKKTSEVAYQADTDSNHSLEEKENEERNTSPVGENAVQLESNNSNAVCGKDPESKEEKLKMNNSSPTSGKDQESKENTVPCSSSNVSFAPQSTSRNSNGLLYKLDQMKKDGTTTTLQSPVKDSAIHKGEKSKSTPSNQPKINQFFKKS